MLTRPLAYKGPNDQLTLLFGSKLLFRGLKILLDEELMDWQLLKDDGVIKGVFFHQQKVIRTSLAWPLQLNHVDNDCNCVEHNKNHNSETESCIHLAALAIESKVQLDRLPAAIKQLESFSSETEYLKHWLKQAHFDPFPNMARHRVVYILEPAPENSESDFSVTVHKAYLTQQNEYQIKAPLPVNTSVVDKLPKFVSLTDQAALLAMQALIENGVVNLNQTNQIDCFQQGLSDCLDKMINTGRCFWRACHRSPIKKSSAFKPEKEWLALTHNRFLNRKAGELVSITDYNKPQLSLLKWLNSAQFDQSKVQPKLIVESHQITLPWRKGDIFEMDIAKIQFEINGQVIEFQDLNQLLNSNQDSHNSQLLETVASHLHLIHWIPGLWSNFEPSVIEQFDPVTRFLSGDLGHWYPLLLGLRKSGWDITFAPSFRFEHQQINDWYSRVSQIDKMAQSGGVETDADWFELEVGIKVDGQPINILPIIVEGLKSGIFDLESEQDFLPITLADGQVVSVRKARVQSIVETLLELAENNPLKANKLRLPENQLVRLNQLANKLDKPLDWSKASKLKEKAKQLSQSSGVMPASIPNNVKAELRDYQKLGVGWLQFLRQQSICGILADDMGLGKTLQALTFIQIEKNNKSLSGPCLIVAPTSLLGNWLAEAKRFTPELKAIHWAGSNRHEKTDSLASADLIITSYGLLLRDAKTLNQLSLDLILLDEAQAIKNSSAKISKIAFSMQSKFKLCLTGTPLENHLGELWSLFHFLMPGLLGDKTQFKRLFQIPIEKEQDWQRQRQLSERVAPFMLRRTKQKVAADLPNKTEIAEFIELSDDQADLYETVRLSMLDEVQKAMRDGTKGGNQLIIGNALLRLRQICCHPDLVKFGKVENATSAKLIWLQAALPELVESRSRILIFSSFTQLLEKLQSALDEMGISYLTLTGKSRNRTQLVEDFQSEKAPVFLISLKAGGAGLNLTKADTVIHFDPWWNPAAEEQASDRAHRIGQDRPVFVYKLIARGTVEEKIYKLQQQKSQLAKELYNQNELYQGITKPDWESLLAPLEKN